MHECVIHENFAIQKIVSNKYVKCSQHSNFVQAKHVFAPIEFFLTP
jgi:hypothetical protein